MAYPSPSSLEEALLKALYASGGSLELKSVYTILTKQFASILTQEDLTRVNKGGDNSWRNRVRWLRETLKARGELKGLSKGVWEITQKGIDRIKTVDQNSYYLIEHGNIIHSFDLEGNSYLDFNNFIRIGNVSAHDQLKLQQIISGDIIAVKTSVSLNEFNVVAYVVAVEREGTVHWQDKKTQDHFLNIELITQDIKLAIIREGYESSFYKISNLEFINLLFNGYAQNPQPMILTLLGQRRRNRKSTTSRNTKSYWRKGSKPFVINPKHNQLQESFRNYLVSKYGIENVKMEENFVDLKVIFKDSVIIYEVKPYAFAEDCIRESLGQIMVYAFFQSTKVEEIVVVGPNAATEEESQIIEFIHKNSAITFSYLHHPLY